MARIFTPRANTIARLTLGGGLLAVGLAAWLLGVFVRSPYVTGAQEPVNQPVMFSHQHHAGDLGIDCRYCHTSVEQTAYAGMPTTEICMTCHSQIWTESPMLAPVRASFQTNTPLQWNRVNDLPDFVYFDHSIHVQNGVGCVTCHGQVDQMAQVAKQQPFNMGWCLDCHRAPEQFLRPRDEVTNMQWQPAGDPVALGSQLAREYHILSPDILTSCSTCHR